jgi:hypothetical protein
MFRIQILGIPVDYCMHRSEENNFHKLKNRHFTSKVVPMPLIETHNHNHVSCFELSLFL